MTRGRRLGRDAHRLANPASPLDRAPRVSRTWFQSHAGHGASAAYFRRAYAALRGGGDARGDVRVRGQSAGALSMFPEVASFHEGGLAPRVGDDPGVTLPACDQRGEDPPRGLAAQFGREVIVATTRRAIRRRSTFAVARATSSLEAPWCPRSHRTCDPRTPPKQTDRSSDLVQAVIDSRASTQFASAF